MFHVYDKKHLDRIPRRYTVEAGKTLEDAAWAPARDAGVYDLVVFGPNGFVRTFAGNTQAAGSARLELNVRYDAAGNRVLAVLTNAGAQAFDATITPNAYRADGPWKVALGAGETAESPFNVAASANWYDFTVSAAGWVRRFAGRVRERREFAERSSDGDVGPTHPVRDSGYDCLVFRRPACRSRSTRR